MSGKPDSYQLSMADVEKKLKELAEDSFPNYSSCKKCLKMYKVVNPYDNFDIFYACDDLGGEPATFDLEHLNEQCPNKE